MNLELDDLQVLREALMDAIEVAASDAYDTPDTSHTDRLRRYRKMVERIEFEISRRRQQREDSS